MGKVTLTEYARLLKDEYCKQTGAKLPTKDYTPEEVSEWHEEYAKWMNDAVVNADIECKRRFRNSYHKEVNTLQEKLREKSVDLGAARRTINKLIKNPPNVENELMRLKKKAEQETGERFKLQERCENLISSLRTLKRKYRLLKENPRYVALVESNNMLSRSPSSIMNFGRGDSVRVLQRESLMNGNQSALILSDIRELEENCKPIKKEI